MKLSHTMRRIRLGRSPDVIRYLTLCLFEFFMISTCFGSYLSVFGINLSNGIAALLFIGTGLCLLVCRPMSIPRKKVLLLAFVWFAFALFQYVRIADRDLYLFGMRTLVINLFLMAALAILCDCRDAARGIAFTGVICFWLSVAFCVYEIRTENFFTEAEMVDAVLRSIRTFFGNPNDCATWIILCFLFASFAFLSVRFGALINLVQWGAAYYVVSYTDSRGGKYALLLWLALYLVAWFGFLVERIFRRTPFYPYVFFAAAFLVFGVVIAALSLYDVDSLLMKLTGDSNFSSDYSRMAFMKTLFGDFIRHPVSGLGSGQSLYYIGINPHNFALELLTEYGVPMFLLIMSLPFSVFLRGFDVRVGLRERAYSFAMLPSIILVGISSSSMVRMRMVWILIAFLYISVPRLRTVKR